jgi:hypothetical protein
MSSVPDGRAANHPLLVITFKPPMGALMARTCDSLKLFSNAEPRCPEVPNEILCPGTDVSGTLL